jgi:hypothetical protein
MSRRPTKTASSVGAQALTLATESRFSPLRSLEPETLVSYIESYEAGDFAWLARTMRAIERRDDIWQISAAKARKDISRRKWQVAPLEGYEDDPEAAAQVELLKNFYCALRSVSHDCRNVASGVRGLIASMMRAYNDGFAVQEILWRPGAGGLSAEVISWPLELFALRSGQLCMAQNDATPLDAGGWLVTRGDGVGIACAVAYMFKRLALADWVVYSGRCGHPGVHGKTAAEKGSTQWTDFAAALRKFGKEWACVTGLDDVIEKIDLSVAGTLPYPGLVERMDRAIASLQRGADLSTLSAGVGSGEGASLQGDESDIIAADNCATITEALRSQVDPYVIAWHRGEGATVRAGFYLAPPQRDTIERDLKIDAQLSGMGVRLSRRDALSRYERREADPADIEDAPLAAAATPAPLALPNEAPEKRRPTSVQAILDRAAAAILDGSRPLAEATAAALREIAALGAAAAALDPAGLQSQIEAAMFAAAAQENAP